MDPVTSKFERLLNLIGGPENLPTQLEAGKSTPSTTLANVETGFDSAAFTQQPAQPAQTNHPPRSLSARNEMTSFAFDPQKGKPAASGVQFSPFRAITRYCYKFIRSDVRQKVASALFDENKIYQREWEIYYISTKLTGVITFVPEQQLLSLICDINRRVSNANVKLRDCDREQGLVVNFDDFPKELRPHLAGRCNTRQQYDYLVAILEKEPTLDVPTKIVSKELDEKFHAMLEDVIDINKASKTARKGRKRNANNVSNAFGSTAKVGLAQAQRHLGLLVDAAPGKAQIQSPGQVAPRAMDNSQPPRHPFESDIIFIAVDVEAWERPPHHVTEVGLATLDTRDLNGVAFSNFGELWRSKIRARHFRIEEHKHYNNHDFIIGCPERFRFGESKFIRKNEAASVLASCFQEPFSDARAIASRPSEPGIVSDPLPKPRNVIVVGHGLDNDIKYCADLGFDILQQNNFFALLDTASLDSTYRANNQTRSLSHVLHESGIEGWDLHNAGNDAVYTLQAMLATCIADACKGPENEVEASLAEGADT